MKQNKRTRLLDGMMLDVITLDKFCNIMEKWEKKPYKSFKSILSECLNYSIIDTSEGVNIENYYIDSMLNIIDFMEATMIIGEGYFTETVNVARYSEVCDELHKKLNIKGPRDKFSYGTIQFHLKKMCHNFIASEDAEWARKIMREYSNDLAQNAFSPFAHAIQKKYERIGDDVFCYERMFYDVDENGYARFKTNSYKLIDGKFVPESTLTDEDLSFINNVLREFVNRYIPNNTYTIDDVAQFRLDLIAAYGEFRLKRWNDNLTLNEKYIDIKQLIYKHILKNGKHISSKSYNSSTDEERERLEYINREEMYSLLNAFTEVVYNIDKVKNINVLPFIVLSDEKYLNSILNYGRNCKNNINKLENLRNYLKMWRSDKNLSIIDTTKKILNEEDYFSFRKCFFEPREIYSVVTSMFMYYTFTNVPVEKMYKILDFVGNFSRYDSEIKKVSNIAILRNCIRHGQYAFDNFGSITVTRWHEERDYTEYLMKAKVGDCHHEMSRIWNFDMVNYFNDYEDQDELTMNDSLIFGKNMLLLMLRDLQSGRRENLPYRTNSVRDKFLSEVYSGYEEVLTPEEEAEIRAEFPNGYETPNPEDIHLSGDDD